MNDIFVISDTHFGHSKILEFENEKRPFKSIEEHDRNLIINWNKIVKSNDTVWHLGDFAFGKDAIHIAKRLNGYKHLVLGNHDHYGIELYQQYFNKIVGSIKIRDYLLTHVPIHPSQKYRFKGNIHGHVHSNNPINDPWYINVSAEVINLTPIELNVLLDNRR